MRFRLPCLFLIAAVACGDPPDPVETNGHDTSNGGELPADGSDVPPSRALGLTATFGELVARARALDDADASDSDAGCLLGGGDGAPFQLAADVSVPLRPLPDAAPDLDARIEGDRAALRVLSRWGQLGTGEPDVAIAVFTATPPLVGHGAHVLFVTDRGVYRRSVGAESDSAGPVALADAGTLVTDALLPVIVTAEAELPLASLRQVLAALPANALVALATTLMPDVRLPDPAAAAQSDGADAGLCGDGGLGPVPDGEAAGSLGADAIVGALAPVRDGAQRCLDAAVGPAAAGGRIAVLIRIGPDGRVSGACAADDDIADPVLRTCLLETVRATAFPAPNPPGSVDVQLPLVLTPDPAARQEPLCR